jgi:hypothetical protein
VSAPELRHPAPTIGAGLAFLLAGAALFVQELGLLTLEWSVVLPAILIVLGVAIVATGAVGAARDRGTGR